MKIQLLCPYIERGKAARLDELLEGLSNEERLDKIQQLVFHLEKDPSIAVKHSPEELFGLSDSALSIYIDSEQDERKARAFDEYQALIKMDFGTGNASAMKCNACGQGGVKWEIKQTRSADEGSTVFCQCQNKLCRARWKM